jgi:hypothetical protein
MQRQLKFDPVSKATGVVLCIAEVAAEVVNLGRGE